MPGIGYNWELDRGSLEMIRLFRVYVPVGTLALLISEIVLLAAAFGVATYITLTYDPDIFLFYEGGWLRIAIVILTILTGLYFYDLYTDLFVKSKLALLQQLCLIIGSAFLLQGFLSYLDADLRVPIRVMLVGNLLCVIGVFSWRIFFTRYALHVVNRDVLLLVGGSPLLEDIGDYVQRHPESGQFVAGYVDDSQKVGADLSSGKLLGPLSALEEIATAVSPNRIVVGMSERRNRVPVDTLLQLRFSGHIIEEAAAVYERVCGRVCLKELRPSQLIYSGELGPSRKTFIYHTALSRIAAGLGILVSLPFMLLTALAVRLSSPGPVLYRQVRVGLNGELFTLYKFRSMRVDAEAVTGAVWASKDDPRVTRVGRIIRKIRFDELPQFFNVFVGEMSLVGPRPERPEFVKEFSEHIPYYRQRHCVRPGITGWAQINYKYGDTLEDTLCKLEYDLFYIKNKSLSLDTYIIFHTVKAMLLSRGSQ
jgi:sugar transferase (PEP-CTERM system associated)